MPRQPVADGGAQAAQEPAPDQQPTQVDRQPTQAPEAPWSGDLQQRFPDEQVRTQVDQYVRETVQPYITRLEQESADDRYAKKLWTDFTENPVDTYLSVTQEMFGDEVRDEAQELLDALAEGDNELDPEFSPEYDENELPPQVQQMYDEWNAQKREDAYYDELERVAAENDDIDFEAYEDLFHPFVSAADGDFDQAVEGFRNFLGRAQGEETEEGAPPPAALDSGSQAPSVPPTEKDYDNLDDALDDFFEEQKPAPPTV